MTVVTKGILKSRYNEWPWLNTPTKYQATPHPTYAIGGWLGGIDHLVALSFGDKVLSFLVAGCLWLFQSPFICLALSNGYQNHIISCRFGFLIVVATSISSSIRRYCLIMRVNNGSVPTVYGSRLNRYLRTRYLYFCWCW